MPKRPRRMVEFMHVFPRKCIITGYPNSEANGPVLDTGRDIEGYGRIYVTESGARLVGEHFGLVPADEYADRIKTLEQENARLQAALDQLPNTIERFLDGLQRDTAHLVRDLLGLVPAPDGGGDVAPGVDGADAPAGDEGALAELPVGDLDDEGAAAAVA